MSKALIFLVAFAQLLAVSAHARVGERFSNLFYDASSLSLQEYVLGRTCFSLASGAQGLTCNPALLADEEKTQLRINLFSEQSIGKASDEVRDLEDEDIPALVNSLNDSHGEPRLTRASTALWYQHDWWALAYVPMRVGLAASVRNPVLTEVTAHIVAESELSFRAGLFAAEDTHLKVGANFRYVSSHYFRDRFQLIDALSDPDILHIQKQRTLYVDPAMAYSWDNNWKSVVSLAVTDVAAYKSGDDKDIRPAIEAGYATTMDIFGHDFRSSVHVTTRSDLDEFRDRLRWGAVYDFSPRFSTTLSLASREVGVGLTGRIDSLTLGLAYKSEALMLNSEKLGTVSQVSAELGLTF